MTASPGSATSFAVTASVSPSVKTACSLGPAFSNGSTNLRIGLQDVTPATGFEDGTFDVYADLVGGTDTIAEDVILATPMESGTKTVTHGDLLAIAIEMTAVLVEPDGIEPTTSCLQSRRSPN